LVPNLQEETLKPEKAQPTDKTYFQTEWTKFFLQIHISYQKLVDGEMTLTRRKEKTIRLAGQLHRKNFYRLKNPENFSKHLIHQVMHLLNTSYYYYYHVL
jgi:hypothetical protein